MKIARITTDKRLLLADELIECPPELEGNRNLFTGLYTGHANHPNYNINNWTGAVVKIKPNTTYTVKRNSPSNRFQIMTGRLDNGIYAAMTQVTRTVGNYNNNHVDVALTITSGENDEYLVAYLSNEGHFTDILLKVEEGSNSTPYTPSPEELGLDYPDFIKKFNQKIYPHGVFLTPEIVEYPSELEGGRNLLEGTWDLSWEKDSHSSYQYLLRPQIQSITKKVEIGDTLTFSFDIDVEQATSIRAYDSNGHPGISYGSQSLNVRQGKQRVSFTKTLTAGSRNTTTWYLDIYNNNNGVKFSVSNIKIEKGTQATPWTPAPEDLGLTYDDGIQSFSFGIKEDRLMVSELIEGGIDISTGKGNGMSSSSMYNSSYSPQNLVDGNIAFGANRAFASANNAPLPQWFQIDLGDVYYVDMVRWINNRTNARLPGDYRIETSTTGAFNGEEILVASKDNNTTYTWVEHRFSDTKCRYVRMTVTKIYAGNYFELAEWQIFGYPAVIGSH